MKDMPKYGVLWTPLLKAMKLLGGSGTVEEIKSVDTPIYKWDIERMGQTLFCGIDRRVRASRAIVLIFGK